MQHSTSSGHPCSGTSYKQLHGAFWHPRLPHASANRDTERALLPHFVVPHAACGHPGWQVLPWSSSLLQERQGTAQPHPLHMCTTRGSRGFVERCSCSCGCKSREGAACIHEHRQSFNLSEPMALYGNFSSVPCALCPVPVQLGLQRAVDSWVAQGDLDFAVHYGDIVDGFQPKVRGCQFPQGGRGSC